MELKKWIGRKVWYRWHRSICGFTGYKMTRDGLASRKGKFWLFLHKIQLPICRILDDWDHIN